jgi:glucose-6-phosphate 1-dehydrogenase
MSAREKSDALVFFGATGDLAFKKIFPALYAMERRGKLKVPVVGLGRSGWSRDQFVATWTKPCLRHSRSACVMWMATTTIPRRSRS